jgi:hypothetical protein
MKAIERIEEFRNLAFGPRESPNWWETLKGEVRQGRSKEVRYLEKTLKAHLDKVMEPADAKAYRSNRRQHFFSRGGNIDGRYHAIGVEEKCARLGRDKLLDGVLCRGLVWSLGNLQDVPPDERGATGIFVTLPGPPLAADLAQAFFGALVLARDAGVHPVFVNGETGEHWPKTVGDSSPLPPWLAVSSPLPSQAPPLNTDALGELDGVGETEFTKPLFGRNKVFSTKEIAGSRVAIAEWSNEWQMLDVGLMLRAMGYAAVKVRYNSKKTLTLGTHGVERRVARGMREHFGVILDWRFTQDDFERAEAPLSRS